MRGIFNSHSVTTLKKEISKTNIKGYSKMKKAEVVNLMVKNQSRFAHIKMNEKKSAPKKTEPRKKIVVTSFPKPKGKPKGKQRVPNEEPAPATLQQAVGNRPKPKPKKKKNLVIKPKVKKEILELPQLKAITGLTKAQANKLDPAELFGLLPSEISKKILNPKATGVKVGYDETRNFGYWYSGSKKGNLNSFLNDFMDSKKESSGRKVGYKSVSSRWKKLIKKKKGEITRKDVMDFYNKEYPDGEYILE
mgnify:CR=1 FL=1